MEQGKGLTDKEAPPQLRALGPGTRREHEDQSPRGFPAGQALPSLQTGDHGTGDPPRCSADPKHSALPQTPDTPSCTPGAETRVLRRGKVTTDLDSQNLTPHQTYWKQATQS